MINKQEKIDKVKINTPFVPFVSPLYIFPLYERNLTLIFEVYIQDKIYSCGIMLDLS